MPTILNVQSSPAFSSSVSRAVSKVFLDEDLAKRSDSTVVDVDLALHPPPHLNAAHLGAFFGAAEDHTAENIAALQASDDYVGQVLSADTILVATPMHNLGITSVLKSWIDNIMRVGKTFQYDETGPVGLLEDKNLVIVVCSGGVYSAGPLKAFDFATAYLRGIFGFLGVTDTILVRAEGLALGPEAAANGVAEAKAAAKAAAATAVVKAAVAKGE